MNAVLVIGATGKTGSALVDLLRARTEPVRAASRTPDAPDAVRFDWDEITTHGPALDGVDRVLATSLRAPPPPSPGRSSTSNSPTTSSSPDHTA